ncbi:DUF2737 family protein [Escherichia coli]
MRGLAYNPGILPAEMIIIATGIRIKGE